jgi:phenylacetic acid degradation operon negative regulatory protein
MTERKDFTQLSQWFEPQAQNLVITLLGSYVHPHDRLVWSGGIVRLLSEFGFSAGAARVALARLVRRELLEREKEGRLVYYRITARAAAVLDEGDDRIFSLGRTPRRADLWTVLWHAIPEEMRVERSRLARRLRFLGFGSLQDGTWISPHHREAEVVSLLEELDVGEHAGLLLARSAPFPDFGKFAARAWDLDALAERYRAFSEEYGPYANGKSASALSGREAFLLRTRLVHMFRQFPFLDPELPDDLIPSPERRTAAVSLFHRLYDALAEPAQAHFDAAMVATKSRVAP